MVEAVSDKTGWLSHQSVQSKLMLALGLVLAVFVTGIVAALVAQEQSDRARRLRAESFERVAAIDELMRAVVDQQLTLRGYVIAADDAFRDAHDNGRMAFSKRLDALRARMPDDALQLTRLEQVSVLMDRYWDIVADPVLGWMERAQTRPQAVAAITRGQDGRYVDEMRRLLEGVQATEAERLAARSQAVEATVRHARWVLVGALVAGFLLGVLTLLVMRAQIGRPLERLAALMEKLAERDQGIAVPYQARRDEVGAIARALAVFKRMAQSTDAEAWVKSGIAAISAGMQQAHDYAAFAEITVGELGKRVDASVARFYRWRPETGLLELVARQGDAGATGSRMVLKLDEGPIGQCARRRQPEVIGRGYPALSPEEGRPQPDTAILRPIVLGDALLGVIELGRAGPPEVHHERLLDELMPILALSLENLSRSLQLRASEAELQRANEALREKSEIAHHQATHDPLTGVPNRLLFMDRLGQAVERSSRSGAIFALCYVDIDGFKPVNDRHGHHAGDVLLGAIALRLLEALRRSDTVARLGGDEFVLLMVDPGGEAQALAGAERLARRLAEPYLLNAPTLPETLLVEVGASVGLALFPADAQTDEGLLRAADAAMYVAKQSGKNRVVRASRLASAPTPERA